MKRKLLPLSLTTLVVVLAACQPAPIDPIPDRLFETAINLPAGINGHGITSADLDGDGQLDLVVASSGENAAMILMGLGDREFTAPIPLAAGPFPKHSVVADFNGDGRLDIAVANQDGHATEEVDDVSIFYQLAGGTFAPALGLAACERPHQVATGDLNGDGYLDLAVACWGEDDFAVIPGSEDGFEDPILVYSGGGAPHAIVVADFDQDGLDDVAIALFGTSRISVLLSEGDFEFAEPDLYAGGSSHHGLETFDLNGDGYPDLVSANKNSHDVSVLRNLGNIAPGSFSTAQTFSIGAGRYPVDLAIGDVDGDGRPDILTANSWQNHPNPPGDLVPTDISVIYGLPGGSFSAPEFFPVDLTPFAILVADLDGDGLLDVATANWNSDDIGILFNAGGDPEPGAIRTTR